MSTGGTDSQPWPDGLQGRLNAFVDVWRPFAGTQRAGAQPFLRGLLAAYGVDLKPGTIFEQHPVRLPAPRAAEHIDMYLPKVCVWAMRAPSEKHLQDHHGQLLACSSRLRTRYMVLCNFHEFSIYDTDDENGQIEPRLTVSLAELPVRGDALLFLRGPQPTLIDRSERDTSEVAGMLGRLVRDVIAAATDKRRAREQVTRFVLECVYFMFAQATDLMPPGLFTRTMREADASGDMASVWAFFAAHGNRAPINGPLFERDQTRIDLSPSQIHAIHRAAHDFQWEGVRPEIFGSIFEQALDPVERHELGAHFTREVDIARVVGPTVVTPWQERIAAIRTPRDAEQVVAQMQAFHVLDPACGCGNFLYVVYREMKWLEAALFRKWTEVHSAGADLRPPPPGPWFKVEQLHGIELEGLAALLARVVISIGEHLASRELALADPTLPRDDLDSTIRHADALVTDWPRPEGDLAIVGNPPYLGVRKLRRELGDQRVAAMFARHPENRAADYVTYWFTRALEVLRPGERAGYVCTNSIAQNESREASIDRLLAAGGTLTDAWRSYPWPGDAAVHIAIVNWVMARWDGVRTLEGRTVASISPGLTEAVDVTTAKPLKKNVGLCFMGVTPGNEGFVLTAEQRTQMLQADPGSHAVILPFLIGRDVSRDPEQQPSRYIIDFGVMDRSEAQAFTGAFRHVQRHVYATKHSELDRKTDAEKTRWWQFVRPRPQMRAAIASLERVLVIPCVSPNLVVSRQARSSCFDHQLMVIALNESYHFGILQSRLHAIWAHARGSTLKGDLRYTNTTIFETFPFPFLAPNRYVPDVRPVGAKFDHVAGASDAFERARRVACKQQELGLTKIHNQLETDDPSPVRAAYDTLNDAVTACYGFPDGVWRDDRETLRLLLALNHRVAALP